MVDQPDAAVRIAVLESQIKGLRENIVLQAREYERRLSELNHAHQLQIDRNADYVSREAWDMKNIELESWRRTIDQWRWISIGLGIAGGGVAGWIARAFK